MHPDSRDRATVSVVIPVKDDDTELARCLEALAAQSRPADEVVVVDNGSTDASAEVARRAGARLVRCEEPGVPAASACGYDTARGDLILRLDADCIPDEAWIEAVVAEFARRPGIGALTGAGRFVDGPPLLRGWLARLYLGAYAVVTASALGHLPLFGSNLAMRREVWSGIRSRVHRDDPALHDDLDLSFHVGERFRIGRLGASPMGISMRPFASASSFATRVSRGFHTVVTHWPTDLPPVRWTRLALRSAGFGVARGRSAGPAPQPPVLA